MAFSTAGQGNTYALSFEASGNLQLGFSRNPNKFGVMKWTELRPALKPSGYFLRVSPEMAARVVYADGRDSLWADKADRPNMNNDLTFEAEPFKCQRRNWGGRIGRIALESAEFLLEEISKAGYTQECLTTRTVQAVNLLKTASWGSNTGNVDGVAGGTPGTGVTLASGQNWTNGTTNAPNIQITIQAAVQAIVQATGGVVGPADLVLVVGPQTASAMGSSPEIRNTFVQSRYAMDLAKGELDPVYLYGLPSKYAGVRIEVDHTVRNSAAAGVTASMGFALGFGDAYLVCRPEGKEIVQTADGKGYDYSEQDSDAPPIVSTVACLVYKDMDVNLRDDPWNERLDVGVQFNGVYVLTSPLTGFYLSRTCG